MSTIAYTQKIDNKGQSMTNYTQIPNWVLTIKIDPYEKALLCAIARYTCGYHRSSVKISLNQLARLGDMSVKKVTTCLKGLQEKNLIIVTRMFIGNINAMNCYALADRKEDKPEDHDDILGTEYYTVPTEHYSDGTELNTVEGTEQSSHSKESKKINNNIPPIVPPKGDVSDESLASQSIEVETVEPVELDSQSVQTKRKPTDPTPAYVLDQFEHFWKTMPLRKVGKDSALRAFVKTTAGKTEAEVIKGTAGLLADLAKRFKHIEGYDSSYRLLHPATYLNQRRWTDEDMPERKSKLPMTAEDAAKKLIVPEDISDGGTRLQKWAVAQGFRAAKQRENAWAYLEAVKAWVAEKNGGAV